MNVLYVRQSKLFSCPKCYAVFTLEHKPCLSRRPQFRLTLHNTILHWLCPRCNVPPYLHWLQSTSADHVSRYGPAVQYCPQHPNNTTVTTHNTRIFTLDLCSYITVTHEVSHPHKIGNLSWVFHKVVRLYGGDGKVMLILSELSFPDTVTLLHLGIQQHSLPPTVIFQVTKQCGDQLTTAT